MASSKVFISIFIQKSRCNLSVMLRAATAAALLLAAIPSVTPMIIGSSILGECRNLSSIHPGVWPNKLREEPPFVALLVLPTETCSGAALTPKYVLGYSFCRPQLEFANLKYDTRTGNSVARLGAIQGMVIEQLYQERPISRFIHYAEKLADVRRHPIMIAELKTPFDTDNRFYGAPIYELTVFSNSHSDILDAEVAAFEHSVNMPIYHQASMDMKVGMYPRHCNKHGRTVYEVGQNGLCTWNVSPVRTICNSDRGAPLLHNGTILGIVIGIIDDSLVLPSFVQGSPSSDSQLTRDCHRTGSVTRCLELQRPESCGEGRIHYNMFLRVENYAPWIYKETMNTAKLMRMEGASEIVTKQKMTTYAPFAVRRFEGTSYRPQPRLRPRSGVGRPTAPQAMPLLIGVIYIVHHTCCC